MGMFGGHGPHDAPGSQRQEMVPRVQPPQMQPVPQAPQMQMPPFSQAPQMQMPPVPQAPPQMPPQMPPVPQASQMQMQPVPRAPPQMQPVPQMNNNMQSQTMQVIALPVGAPPPDGAIPV